MIVKSRPRAARSTGSKPAASAPQSGTPTILDVAESCGLSKSTVSLALQGSPLLRPQTVERVREAAQRLGYVYNRGAAGMRRKSTNLVGVVINDLFNPFYAELLVGLEHGLTQAGYITLMVHSGESAERQLRLLAALREHNAAGLLLCPAMGSDATLLTELQGWGLPFVVLMRPLSQLPSTNNKRRLGGAGYDYIGADHAQGFALATTHLLQQGHRRIAFLGGTSGIAYAERLRGYQQALDAAKVKPVARWVMTGQPSQAGGLAMMRQLLEQRVKASQPDAAVCYNDATAFGALQALGEHGLLAGRDFALMGYDNVLASAHSNPALSTVDIQPQHLGELAAQTLLQRLREPEMPAQYLLSQPTLVLRQTA